MMPSPAHTMDALETVLKALADQTRLRILGLLAAGEVCVCHIHESLRLPQPTVSRHLAYLRRAGLVHSRKDGLWVHYQLAAPSSDVLATVVDTVTHCTTHIAVTARDRARLARLTGGDPAGETRRPVLGCCGS